ncbi:Bacterial membrane protein YfhO [compost metagenome]
MIKKIVNSNYFVFLLFLFVIGLVYRGTINNSTLLVKTDGIGYYLSKYYLVDSLKSGEIPLWNPFVALGTPFLSDVQQTVFSPFNLIYLVFDTIIGFNFTHILQLTFAGFFMFLYINELFGKKNIGVIIGFIFAFSSMIGGARIDHTVIISTIIFCPLILFFLERYKSTGKDKYLVYSSIGMAIQFLSGFTQIVIYFDIVYFVYFIYVSRFLKFNLKMILTKLIKWLAPYILLCAVQWIPTLQLMGQSNRDAVSYEFFSVLAYDLRILFMMIFPYGYLSSYEPFGSYASSGVDIEIYIGIVPLIYLLYAIVYHYKDKFVKLISIIMIGTFIFGMAPNIPYLGKLIYSIPIIGSFRVSARVISIFLICGLILFGYTLSKLNKKEEIIKLFKFSAFLTIIVLSNVYILKSTFSQPSIPAEISVHYALKGEVFLNVIILCFVNLIGLGLLCYRSNKGNLRQAILLILCIATIIDVGKYSIIKGTTPSDNILNDHTPQKVQKLIKEDGLNYRSFAMIDSSEQVYDDQMKIAKLQRNMIQKQMFFNSYMTFYDEKYKNYNINETLLYPSTINSLNTRNDLISMMSIRYINDAWNHAFSTRIPTNEVEKNILTEGDLSILGNDSQLSVTSYPVKLEPNSAYKVTIEMTATEMPELFYVDFYNDTYDNPAQDGSFDGITIGKNNYSTVIQTGSEVPLNQVYFRLISQSSSDMKISNIKIEKVKLDNIYKQVLNEDGVTVYENLNAKPILYTPTHVKAVNSFDSLYSENSMGRLDEYSYIEGFNHDMDLSQVNTNITNIVQKNNSITASVISDKDTFINHSQLSYPGWKAYVDGKQVPVYNVNNLIQGAQVPKGKHQITFVYDPLDVKLGFLLTMVGIALSGYYLFSPTLRRYFKDKRL